MDKRRMKELIEQHIAAEMAGDTAGAVSVDTEDVEHDMIGSPTGPVHGPAAAQGFYDHLVADLDTERMTATREQYGDDFCVIEHEATCVIKGAFMGIPGNGRRVIRLRSLTSASRATPGSAIRAGIPSERQIDRDRRR
jgi:hypothetical protein